ncbi:MAG TPA: DinB family protein [Roseiflexaceae bacterium]|nr:DinB family protein [Roseiflexaceae bacterium]
MDNLNRIIDRMRANSAAIAALCRDVGDAQMRWKPAAEDWSLLEVVNHLYDEEREDFRTRVDYVLHRPGEQAPPIDPEGWVTARGYNARDPRESLEAFLRERDASLEWLRSLRDPNCDAAYQAPWGVLHAGDLLVAWLAHDHLHLRQLNELHYAYHAQQAAPYSVEYAGDW